MFPTSTLQYFPKIFQSDPKAIYLASYLDTQIAWIRAQLLGFKRFFRPDECPAVIVDELGYMLAADIRDTDSDQQARIKVATAMQKHKRRGTWKNDVKPIIDLITGYDAELYYNSSTFPEWVVVGNLSSTEVPTGYYWAVIGTDGIDVYAGIAITGAGTEPEIKGNVYIDLTYGVHSEILTPEIIEIIRFEITSDIIPAYFSIRLGWVNSNPMNAFHAFLMNDTTMAPLFTLADSGQAGFALATWTGATAPTMHVAGYNGGYCVAFPNSQPTPIIYDRYFQTSNLTLTNSGDFTISMYIYSLQKSQVLFSAYDSYDFMLTSRDAGFAFYIEWIEGGTTITNSGLLSFGYWMHVGIVGTADGIRKLYIDGYLNKTGTIGSQYQVTGLKKYLLGASVSTIPSFMGKMQDVRFFNRAASDADMLVIAAQAPITSQFQLFETYPNGVI